MHKILSVQNITKHYRDAQAVSDVSFHVAAGEIVGLLGPNGAGKTTIINMILGVLEPTSGIMSMDGEDLNGNRRTIMERVNFAATYAHLPGNMTVRQNLYVFGMLYGINRLKEMIVELLKEFELDSFANTKLGVLSSGEQSRAALAKALINQPRLLLLDEPTASLDPNSAHFVRDKIRTYATHHGAAILWTSHNMYEVEAVCDRVLFLSHGTILLEGHPREITKQHNKANLEELFIAVAREPLTFEK